jgi:hypothetical protein
MRIGLKEPCGFYFEDVMEFSIEAAVRKTLAGIRLRIR